MPSGRHASAKNSLNLPARRRRREWTAAATLMLLAGLAPLAAAPPASRPAARSTAVSTPASQPPDPPMPVDSRQEAQLLKLAGPDFQLRRTPHFLLAYNTNPGLVDQLAARLEHTYAAVYRFAAVVGIQTARPARRLEVIFFNRREEYDRYGTTISFPSPGTYGVYYEPTNRSAFFNVYNDPPLLQLHAEISEGRENLAGLTDTLKRIKGNQPIILTYGDGRQERLTRNQARKRIEEVQRQLKTLDGQRANYSEWVNQTIVQHEAAHQVLFNAGVHVRKAANPKWIVEGLACLFETPPGEWGTGMAATNQLRLKDFRAGVAGPTRRLHLKAEDFVAAVHDARVLSPEQLVCDPHIFLLREERGANAYAMCWSLTHYLQRRQPRQLAAYLRTVASREPGREVSAAEELALFEAHFGKLDESFLRQWGGHTLQLAYRPPAGIRAQ